MFYSGVCVVFWCVCVLLWSVCCILECVFYSGVCVCVFYSGVCVCVFYSGECVCVCVLLLKLTAVCLTLIIIFTNSVKMMKIIR